MKQIIAYKFEDSDFEILKQGVPRYPCEECNHPSHCNCTNCNKQEEYYLKIRKLRKSGLLDYMEMLDEIVVLNKSKKEIEKRLSILWGKLPEGIKARPDILQVYKRR